MPIRDQASRPHRAARATKGLEKKGPRSLSMERRSQLLHRGCQVRVILGDVFPPTAQRQPPRGRWVHFGAMLPTVPVPPRHLDDYRETAGPEAVERLRKVAAPLAG